MQTDAFAGVFAETVAEDEEDDHHCEGESLREDFCTEEDGVINAVGQNRSTENSGWFKREESQNSQRNRDAEGEKS